MAPWSTQPEMGTRKLYEGKGGQSNVDQATADCQLVYTYVVDTVYPWNPMVQMSTYVT